MTEAVQITRRPSVVTFVGVVIYIQALLDAIVSLVVFLERNDPGFQEVTGQSADELLGAGIGSAIAAIALLWVASGVMSGARWARLMVGVVQGARMALSLYWLLTHVGGGFQWNAIITTGISMFVLWALYGNSESEAFFDRAR